MKRIHFTIVFACVLTLCFAESYLGQSAATIEGVVLDAATNQPLAGVRVGLTKTGLTPIAYNPPELRVPPTLATTDAQGHFSLQTNEVGRVRLVPTRDGYTSESQVAVGRSAVCAPITTPGAIVQGTVRDTGGVTLPGAVVALVPEAPYRSTGLLYRSVIADPNGKFEIHGIAPGSYKMFAWPELEGAAYRNADFMKEYEERGKPVKIEKGGRLSVDLTAF